MIKYEPQPEDQQSKDAADSSSSAEEYHKVHGKDSDDSQPRRVGCPDYFGVKSYLDNFYETHTYKDPSIYEEDDDYRFLLNPKARRRHRCAPIWLKVCVWLGINLLLFGIIGIVVGYFVPRKLVINKFQSGDSVAYIDHEALRYNTALDLCKLLGLIFFCVGGILLASALLFPSFLASQCEEDPNEAGILVRTGDDRGNPGSPIERSIPATSKLKSIQPSADERQTMRAPRDVTFQD